jgi:hypothetical protein
MFSKSLFNIKSNVSKIEMQKELGLNSVEYEVHKLLARLEEKFQKLCQNFLINKPIFVNN